MSSTEVTVKPPRANSASAASAIRRRRFSIRASRRSCADGNATTALPLAGRQGPRDDQPLDLAGAFEQRVDLGVAVPLLDGEVADVAVAAADLNRLLGDLDRHLAGLQLGHRTFGVLELAVVPAFPQRAPDERAG